MPRRVQIGPYRYRIRQELGDFGLLRDSSVLGRTLPAQCQLQIHPKMAADQKPSVLLHELIHAVLDAAGVENDRCLSVEEMICHLTPGLLRALRDNPKLVRYLLKNQS